jgi:hypothetical protein
MFKSFSTLSGRTIADTPLSIMWMLHFAIRRALPGRNRLPFALYVRNHNRAAKLVKLIAHCGPLDIDKPEPAITVMMSDED